MKTTVRLMTAADLPQADHVLREAFDSPWSFAPILSVHQQIEPRGFWVATQGNQVLATAATVNYGTFAYLSLMAVHPRAQRRGLGRRLLTDVLAQLDRARCPRVLLEATAAGAPVYRQLGFVDCGLTYEFRHGGNHAAGPALHVVRRAEAADLAEITAFDTPYFGADRSRVVFALWALQPERWLVSRDAEGEVQGYLFAQDPFLGPWVARDLTVAASLLATALSLPFNLPPRAFVSQDNPLAPWLLGDFGFHEVHALRRMRRGPLPPGQPGHIYGQSGFALG